MLVRTLFNVMCMCVYMWLLHIGQKNMSDPLRLGMIVSCPTWEPSPWSSIPNKNSFPMCKGLKDSCEKFTPNRIDQKKELDRYWFSCFQCFLACFWRIFPYEESRISFGLGCFILCLTPQASPCGKLGFISQLLPQLVTRKII